MWPMPPVAQHEHHPQTSCIIRAASLSLWHPPNMHNLSTSPKLNRVRPQLKLNRVRPLLWFFGVLFSSSVWAGAQQYEPLSVAVQTALAAAVQDQSPPDPIFDTPQLRIEWMATMSDRLPRRHKPVYEERIEFLKTVRYEAQRAGLEPELVLGLIEVESYFRRHAISSAGARGYMQVMPFWTKLIGNGEANTLFDMRTNVRMGCLILRHYLDIEKGDLFRALGRYNGSLGRPEYPNAVLKAWRKWEFISKPTSGKSSNDGPRAQTAK